MSAVDTDDTAALTDAADTSTPASSAQPAPQGQTSAVNTDTPASSAPAPQVQTPSAQPQGVQTVAQSEPSPQQPQGKDPRAAQVDPRYLQWFQKEHPDVAKVIESAAQEAGVDPNALAFHKYNESGSMMEETPRGSSGEIGPGQLMPATSQQYSRNGQLDPHNPVDNLRMAADVIKGNDDQFGRNTPSSFLAYQAGAGTVNKIAKDPEFAGMYAKQYPQAVQRMASAFPYGSVGISDINPSHTMDPKSLVNAGTQGGPQGFLSAITQTAAPGSDTTDAWRQAEGAMTQFFLSKGDVEGAQHARDYVLQMSHTGAMQYMSMAHEMLSSGDAAGAGRALAKAHAFFPDGTMGQFGVDSKGNLYGQQKDEETGQTVGQFQVTPDSIASTINQIQNPRQYLQSLLAMQKQTATIRQQGLTAQHQNIMEQQGQERLDNQDRRADQTDRRLDIQQQGVDGRGAGAKIPGAATPEQANKAADNLYGNDSDNAAMPIEQRAKLSAVMKDGMQQGSSATESQFMAEGLGKGDMGLGQPQGNGRVPVIGKKDGQVHGYISAGLAHRLAGGQAPGAGQGVSTTPAGVGAANSSPVGAGAGTPVARASGMSANLAGTQTQSSAVPTQAGQ